MKLLELKRLLFLWLVVGIFFWPFLLHGNLPIPADTIVGLYHPWRDLHASEYSNGIPFKNFLITDPVRQLYPWKELAISLLKKGEVPLWNPYSFAGTPLLANFQSAPFYPFNLLFFFLPFPVAWSFLIMFQPLLGASFLYLYLRKLRIEKIASLLGAVVFAFSGFSIAWMEWGNILSVIIWLPLILLAKDHLVQKISLKWVVVMIFAEISAVFAGHLQVLFYTILTSDIYLIIQIIKVSKIKGNIKESINNAIKLYKRFVLLSFFIFLITAIQWLPTLQFIQLSARNVDQANWQKIGWFIPWEHLLQFVIPDFFGNPATLNFWGKWNYGEFIGYIGITPLLLALVALFFRQDKKTLFFGGLAIVTLLVALPTPIAKLPFILQIPFLSTAQPTRLLSIVDFSLAILAAFGLDYLIRHKITIKKIIIPIAVVGTIFLGVWILLLLVKTDNFAIATRNSYLPTAIFLASSPLLLSLTISNMRQKYFPSLAYFMLLGITLFDLFRFGWKFTPFVKSSWLYPTTSILSELKKDPELFRFMTTDSRIIPPNFSIIYKLQSVSGYDPLYLTKYGEFITMWNRNKPDYTNTAFNRIIEPKDYNSPLAKIANVKYVLSLIKEDSSLLELISQEESTYLYKLKNYLPRIFFVEDVLIERDKKMIAEAVFDERVSNGRYAIVEEPISGLSYFPLMGEEKVEVQRYSENMIILSTLSREKRFLVVSDVFYPSWRAFIDGVETKIYRTNFTFRGIAVPVGRHEIVMKISL